MNIFSLLGVAGEVSAIGASAYTTFKGIVNVILPVIASFLLVLGIILGVKVGVAFAKAEDDEAKKKAKGQLINIVIGFLVAIVFVAIITAVRGRNCPARGKWQTQALRSLEPRPGIQDLRAEPHGAGRRGSLAVARKGRSVLHVRRCQPHGQGCGEGSARHHLQIRQPLRG